VLPPSAPEPPVVSEVHGTDCTVTYLPPSDDGGAPVTGYILERRTPASRKKWIRVNNTPVTDLQYTIAGLKPAREYEFRVAALNTEGEGEFSQNLLKIMTAEKADTPGLTEISNYMLPVM